jgi:hypothetical protein
VVRCARGCWLAWTRASHGWRGCAAAGQWPWLVVPVAGGLRWSWLDATGSDRSGSWRVGEDGVGGVLCASDSCGGEVVGAPLLFLDDDAGLAPPRWWGWGVVQVPASGFEVGLRAVLGLFRQRHDRAKGSVLLPWLGACDWLGANPSESFH